MLPILLMLLSSSAITAAAPLQLPGYFTAEEGVVYDDDPIAFSSPNASSVEECASMCNTLHSCLGFTFYADASFSSSSSCVGRSSMLKPSSPLLSVSAVLPGGTTAQQKATSYVRYAAVVPGKVDGFVKLREGFDFVDSTISILQGVPSSAACAKGCLNVSGCKLFVYYPKETPSIAHEWWLGIFPAGSCRLVRGARGAVPAPVDSEVHAYMLGRNISTYSSSPASSLRGGRGKPLLVAACVLGAGLAGITFAR